MDVLKMWAAVPQSVPTGVTTQLTLSPTPLINAGGSSLAADVNSIKILKAGYYLVTVELLVVGTGSHKLFIGRGSSFKGPNTETSEVSGTAGGVNYGRTLIIRASATSFLFLQALHDGGGNRDYQVSICAAKLSGA